MQTAWSAMPVGGGHPTRTGVPFTQALPELLSNIPDGVSCPQLRPTSPFTSKKEMGFSSC